MLALPHPRVDAATGVSCLERSDLWMRKLPTFGGSIIHLWRAWCMPGHNSQELHCKPLPLLNGFSKASLCELLWCHLPIFITPDGSISTPSFRCHLYAALNALVLFYCLKTTLQWPQVQTWFPSASWCLWFFPSYQTVLMVLPIQCINLSSSSRTSVLMTSLTAAVAAVAETAVEQTGGSSSGGSNCSDGCIFLIFREICICKVIHLHFTGPRHE